MREYIFPFTNPTGCKNVNSLLQPVTVLAACRSSWMKRNIFFHEAADKTARHAKALHQQCGGRRRMLAGSTCLVCANGGCAAHGLCSSQVAYEVVVCQHAFHRVGQRNCHSQGKPFWYGHHLRKAHFAYFSKGLHLSSSFVTITALWVCWTLTYASAMFVSSGKQIRNKPGL